eukprot:306913_1
MKQCDVILTALNSYLLDVVDQVIIRQIMQNLQNTIHNVLQHHGHEVDTASQDIIHRLFALISRNTLELLSSVTLFITKYSYFVETIKNVMNLFKQYHFKPSSCKEYPCLSKDYQHRLVQHLVSFYLEHANKGCIHDVYFTNSIIYLTGEFCEYLNNEQIFNVFNYILPTFLNEPSFIELSILTAITKIYLKINNESKPKILPLLQHIFALCNDHHLHNLDVRCRAAMYQRLIQHNITAAKKIVL